MTRLVNLVNDQDEIIGQTDLLDAHRGEGKKHQAVSWFLFRRVEGGQLELLLQQRSQEKIVGALQWANTLCANVAPGETHLQCLRRRSQEELGLTWQAHWQATEAAVLDYQVACENGFSENEIDHFFVTILERNEGLRLKPIPNPREVFGWQWRSWQAVQTKQLPSEMKISPWFSLFLNNPQVMKAINRLCQ